MKRHKHKISRAQRINKGGPGQRSPKVSRGLEVSSQSAILHLLENKPERIERIFFRVADMDLSPRMSKLRELADSMNVSVDIGPRRGNDLDSVVAFLRSYEYTALEDIITKASEKTKSVVLVLDHLQDPQNLGALARTAEGLGVDGIIIPKERSVGVSSGVYQASVGAVESIGIARVVNLRNAVHDLKEAGYWIVGTSIEEGSKPPTEIPDYDRVALVLGTELGGMALHLGKSCDLHTNIPLVGQVQSLNVSVAGALLMYEFTRRHSSEV